MLFSKIIMSLVFFFAAFIFFNLPALEATRLLPDSHATLAAARQK